MQGWRAAEPGGERAPAAKAPGREIAAEDAARDIDELEREIRSVALPRSVRKGEERAEGLPLRLDGGASTAGQFRFCSSAANAAREEARSGAETTKRRRRKPEASAKPGRWRTEPSAGKPHQAQGGYNEGLGSEAAEGVDALTEQSEKPI